MWVDGASVLVGLVGALVGKNQKWYVSIESHRIASYRLVVGF